MPKTLRFPGLLAVCYFNALTPPPANAEGNDAALRDISDHKINAQQLRSAVASRTLTWLTGSSVNNDYISVGRLANFFGFVALRVSSDQSLTRAHVARDTLATLDPSQIEVLVALLKAQNPEGQRTQAARLEMNRALERLLVQETVSKAEFLKLGRAYGAAEAELGRVIAKHFGKIAQSLTGEQKTRLADIRTAYVSGQPEQLDRSNSNVSLPDVDRKELVNLAARFLSWTTGSPELNDFEVVGKPSQHFGFVSLRLASGHGVKRGAIAREVIDLLDREQQAMLGVAVEENTADFNTFLAARAQLMRTLEVALHGEAIDPETVMRLGADLGETEARMTWSQADAMLKVRSAMSEDQLSSLLTIRGKYTVSEAESGFENPVDRGRTLFAQCALCHLENDNAVAPDLSDVIGRSIAGDTEFDRYSPALKGLAGTHGTWSLTLLDQFLRAPRSLVPGTTMGYDGLTSAEDRAALLAYLARLD